MYFILKIKYYTPKLVYYAPKILPLVILFNIVLMARLLDVADLSQGEPGAGHTRAEFYMTGSQNIDLKQFHLLINNNICDKDDIKIVTIISTSLENKVGRGSFY